MHLIPKIGAALASAALALTTALPAVAQYYGRQGGYGMMGGGHGLFGGFLMVLFIAVIIAVVVLLVYWLTGSGRSGPPHHRSGPTPLDVLEERFARGEIDSEEFQERKKHLSK